MVSGSADGMNPSEGSFTGERLALAEALSAPLQADEPFERVVRTVLDGMVRRAQSLRQRQALAREGSFRGVHPVC